jgi:DNA-binding NarL/FixJ family response regulator
MKNLRILVADDHDLMRRGLKAVLEARPGWTVCGEATSGHEAVAKAGELKPDVVILDVCMPNLNGVEATRQIRRVSPRSEVLVLSVHHSDQLIRDILDAGARGFLVKADPDADVVSAVTSLADRKPFFTSCATEMLLRGRFREISSESDTAMPGERLTPREREVVQLIAEGKTSKEVATTLDIRTKTAETHRSNIMRKLEFHSISEIVRYAVRNEMIDP